jgi:toxin CptA
MSHELRIALGSSRVGAAFAVVAGAATLVLLAALPVAALTKGFGILWIALSTVDAFGALVRCRGSHGVRGLQLCDRAITVEGASGALREGEVRDGSFVSPWLTILRWRPHGARRDRTIVILPDMLDPDTFRALRVYLRMA